MLFRVTCSVWCSCFGALAQELSAVFENHRSESVSVLWDDGSASGVEMFTMGAGGSRAVDTHLGHVFKVARKTEDSSELVTTFSITSDQDVYIVEPDPGEAVCMVDGCSGVTNYSEVIAKMSTLGGIVNFISASSAASPEMQMAVQFRNFRQFRVDRYWADPSGREVFQGSVMPLAVEEGVTTYPGHIFLMKRADGKNQEVVERLEMNPAQRIYVLDPAPDDEETFFSSKYQDHLVEMDFRDAYFTERGLPWLGCYPPKAPTLPMVPMPQEGLGTVARRVHFREESRAWDGLHYADLIALSSGPPQGTQAFLIEDLLTPSECEHIQELSLPHLRRSGVGSGPGREAETRTSDTTFLNRDRSPTLDLVHRRMADVLGISDTDLGFVAEHLQVVRYQEKQMYAPHFDFSGGNGIDRLATLLVYLQPAEEGGGTSFPKAFPPHGLALYPKLGSAILFYSKLPDGNLDEMSAHAGMSVIKGTKMVCNLWVRSLLPAR